MGSKITTNVLVDLKTGVVLETNVNGGTSTAVEIDAIYNPGGKLKPGDRIDPATMKAYEIKTSAGGKVDPAQIKRYEHVFGTGNARHYTSKYKIDLRASAPVRGGLRDNVDYFKRMRLLTIVFAIAGSAASAKDAYAFSLNAGTCDEFEDLKTAVKQAKDHQDIHQQYLSDLKLISIFFDYMQKATGGYFDNHLKLLEQTARIQAIGRYGGKADLQNDIIDAMYINETEE